MDNQIKAASEYQDKIDALLKDLHEFMECTPCDCSDFIYFETIEAHLKNASEDLDRLGSKWIMEKEEKESIAKWEEANEPR